MDDPFDLDCYIPLNTHRLEATERNQGFSTDDLSQLTLRWSRRIQRHNKTQKVDRQAFAAEFYLIRSRSVRTVS